MLVARVLSTPLEDEPPRASHCLNDKLQPMYPTPPPSPSLIWSTAPTYQTPVPGFDPPTAVFEYSVDWAFSQLG